MYQGFEIGTHTSDCFLLIICSFRDNHILGKYFCGLVRRWIGNSIPIHLYVPPTTPKTGC